MINKTSVFKKNRKQKKKSIGRGSHSEDQSQYKSYILANFASVTQTGYNVQGWSVIYCWVGNDSQVCQHNHSTTLSKSLLCKVF